MGAGNAVMSARNGAIFSGRPGKSVATSPTSVSTRSADSESSGSVSESSSPSGSEARASSADTGGTPRTAPAALMRASASPAITLSVTGVIVRWVVCGRVTPKLWLRPGCSCSIHPCDRTSSAQWCGSTLRSSGTLSSVAMASSGPTGEPTTRKPSMKSMSSTRKAVDLAQDAASSASPSRPSARVMAQPAASAPADFEPSIVALTTGYPGHCVVEKYCARWRSRPRVSSTDMPFGAYANLWRSALMLVTPSTRKSQGSRPSQNGSTHPPMHASTWQSMPRSSAAAAIAAIGSMAACG